MKRNLCILLAFVVAISVAVALRCAVFGIYLIPHDTQRPTLMAGDRVLVRKWAYGVRMPWWKAGKRKCVKAPQQGDWVAFSTSAGTGGQTQNGIGCLMACPGDTVWTGPQYRVSPVRDYAHGCIWPLVVPGKGMTITMSPWNVALYARTISAYEGAKAGVRSDRLLVNGQVTRTYPFHRDYYWIYSGAPGNLHDSRTLGFLPGEAIVGQATTLLYSLDSEQPWYSRLRGHRTLSPLGGRP